MARAVLGVLVGAIVWMAGFYVCVLVLAQLWSDYAVHGRQWTTQGVFTFTPVMACCNLLFWALAAVAAGWACAKLGKRRSSLWVLAGLLGIYLAGLHFVFLWQKFPWWYNLAVVLPTVPLVLLGGKLAVPNLALGRAAASG
jgi:hypothetical protein